VLLYCDTGMVSSRAYLALKLAGYDNLKVLLGGYRAWTAP
jgi:rhodanese-related sulfurtransferase